MDTLVNKLFDSQLFASNFHWSIFLLQFLDYCANFILLGLRILKHRIISTVQILRRLIIRVIFVLSLERILLA